MKRIEELKAEIKAMVAQIESEEMLHQILEILENKKKPLERLSDAEEAALARGIADWEAGRTISHEEFIQSLKERKERRAVLGKAS